MAIIPKDKFIELLKATEVRKVDYKRDQYLLNNENLKSKFIKDILCITNSPGDDGYIVLGVKSDKGQPRLVVGIDSHHDSSILESIVNGIIEEPIQFEYYPLSYKGNRCALIHIPVSKSRPHWPKRNLGILKKHMFYTRRASANKEASFAEIREMFLSAIRISEVARQKIKSSRHIVDELIDFSHDERIPAMYKMLKNVAKKAGFQDYRSIQGTYLSSQRQQFAIIRSLNSLISEFSVIMYPWNVKGNTIPFSRGKIDYFSEIKYTSYKPRTGRVTAQIKSRIKQSTIIHISYKNIYTTALQKRPYTPTPGLYFANEWKESWGKVMKWEDHRLAVVEDKAAYAKKTKYEFFLPNVASQDELKERLEMTLKWINDNIG